jgi:glycosyltransferase involved in cell wall biosynthesis
MPLETPLHVCPLVTVIVPTFNRASFLEQTIDSILGQDYPNIELIVLDDGSIDDTPDVLAKYGEHIVVERHDNIGETLTVNKGFKLAHGEYVCVVNSDDPILPGLIRAGVIALECNPTSLAAYPDWLEIGPCSERLAERTMVDYSLETMLRQFNVAIGPGVMIRRTAFDIVGLRNPQLRYTGDLDFWFRVMLHGQMVHIPNVLATHRVHPGAASVTARDARMSEEVVRLAYMALAHPNCPAGVRKHRRRILANAHFEARNYCGKDRRARRGHYLRYLLFNPVNVVRVMAALCRQFAVIVRAVLRRCLGSWGDRLWAVLCFHVIGLGRRVGFRGQWLWAALCFHIIRLFLLRDIRRGDLPGRASERSVV